MLEALLISALLITAATAIEPPLRQLAPDLLEIHFIGDIHGDAECAQQWLRRTGAVNLDATPPQWIMPKSAVVFMGDYVDKGVASPATLNFVKMLTERFPDNVVAMLGNHDLFALIDASTVLARADNFTSMPHASPMETTHPMGGPVSRYVYAFQHPEEFLRSGYSPHREDDEELLSALMTAILHIYAANSESRVSMATEAFDQSGGWSPLWTATLFKDGGDLEERVKTRLRRWIQEYSEGLQRGEENCMGGAIIFFAHSSLSFVPSFLPISSSFRWPFEVAGRAPLGCGCRGCTRRPRRSPRAAAPDDVEGLARGEDARHARQGLASAIRQKFLA